MTLGTVFFIICGLIAVLAMVVDIVLRFSWWAVLFYFVATISFVMALYYRYDRKDDK
jgi:membrane protein implicated in regulation of membrane protease activity